MRADVLSGEFAAALRCPAMPAGSRPARCGLVGIENEYHVVRQGARVDFTSLIDGLSLGRRFLDPGDANARRLQSGAAVTCDGAEAEVALPPIALRPGFSAEVRRRAATERRSLCDRLGEGFALDGSSTHISVSVPAPVAAIDALARLHACTFAPSLMLLLDRRDSYGIYLRPRPGRLEVCGEYATGDRLQAAVVFAAGSVRALRAALRQLHAPLPPRVRVRVEPCSDRYGHLVHRLAAGGDLYRDGRAAPLTLESGEGTTAQRQLEAAWSIAREAMVAFAGAGDLDVVDRIVFGDAPLPATDPEPEERAEAPEAIRPGVFGRMIQSTHRPGFDMAAVMLTWDAAVLLAERQDGRRRAFICVPRGAMERFVAAIDSGRLDMVIEAYLRSRGWGRRLHHRGQLALPGLYDAIGPRRALLAEEPRQPRLDVEAAA